VDLPDPTIQTFLRRCVAILACVVFALAGPLCNMTELRRSRSSSGGNGINTALIHRGKMERRICVYAEPGNRISPTAHMSFCETTFHYETALGL
jgi:hypothetical protein